MNETEQITTIIFDLDGVLLGEKPYWETAAATAQAIFCEVRLDYVATGGIAAIGPIPLAFIDELKGRGVNSNWELTEIIVTAGLCLSFLKQSAATQERIAATELQLLSDTPAVWKNWTKLWAATVIFNSDLSVLLERFWQHAGSSTGHAVMEFWAKFLSIECSHLKNLWQSADFRGFIRRRFQEILVSYPIKTSAIVDLPSLHKMLARLNHSQFVLGIATGRPQDEALAALEALDLLRYFVPDRIITYNHVIKAQLTRQTLLAKPHPYSLLQAAYPTSDAASLCSADFIGILRSWLVYIGDSGSDALTAKAAGAEAWMVLTGCADASFKPRRRQQFMAMQVTRIYPDVLELLSQLIREAI